MSNNGSETSPPTPRTFFGLTAADGLKMIIPFLLGLLGATFLGWWNTKEAHLRQEISEIVPVEVEKGQVGLVVASLVNDGTKEAEDIEVRVRVAGAKIEEPKVSPKNLKADMTVEGDTIVVNLKMLNPRESEKLQITGLVRSIGELPAHASIESRGKGLVGDTTRKKTKEDYPLGRIDSICLGMVLSLVIVEIISILRILTKSRRRTKRGADERR